MLNRYTRKRNAISVEYVRWSLHVKHIKKNISKHARIKLVLDIVRLNSSAFGGIFADWKVDIPVDYDSVDSYSLLRAALHAMEDPILKHNAGHTKRLKFTASAYVVFQKAVDPEIKTEPPVGFTTPPRTVLPTTDVQKQLNRAYDNLVVRIESYEGFGSGWVIDYRWYKDLTPQT